MCKPKKPKPVEIPDPVYVKNAYLDSSFSPLNQQKTGRNSLRNPLGGGLEIPTGPGAGRAAGWMSHIKGPSRGLGGAIVAARNRAADSYNVNAGR